MPLASNLISSGCVSPRSSPFARTIARPDGSGLVLRYCFMAFSHTFGTAHEGSWTHHAAALSLQGSDINASDPRPYHTTPAAVGRGLSNRHLGTGGRNSRPQTRLAGISQK